MHRLGQRHHLHAAALSFRKQFVERQIARKENDLATRRDSLDAGRQLNSVHLGHPIIRNQKIGRHHSGQFQGIGAAVGAERRNPAAVQNRLQRLRDHGLVVDNENQRPIRPDCDVWEKVEALSR